jgi:hypothetical protein
LTLVDPPNIAQALDAGTTRFTLTHWRDSFSSPDSVAFQGVAPLWAALDEV